MSCFGVGYRRGSRYSIDLKKVLRSGELNVFSVSLILIFGSAQANPSGFVLISSEEYMREQSTGLFEKSVSHTCGKNSPKIVLSEPDLTGGEAGTPVDIKLEFAPSKGALIDLASFNVQYGFLKLDITERLLSRAEFVENGLRVLGAEMPSGKHSLHVSISDDRARTCTRSFKFRIVDS